MALYLRGDVWWIKYKVGGVTVRESTGVKGRANKGAAKIREGDVLSDAALRIVGRNTFRITRETPLAQLVEDYRLELVRRGRTENHARQTANRITRMTEGCHLVAELTPDRIRKALGRITEAGDTRTLKPKNFATRLSAKSANDFRASLCSFFAWLVKTERWDRNPVLCVERVRRLGPEKPRVALQPEQLVALLESEKLPATRRACYLLAATTGLRRAELRALRWSMIDLEGATVTLPAKHAKNRKPVVLPLREDAVEALAAIADKAGAEGEVFRAIPETRTFFQDLVKAKVLQRIEDHETADGVLDFHGLRVTFATLLARSDVSLQQAQKLMRHSTPVLTANVYTKLELHDGRAAVAKIDLTPKRAETEAVEARATGTTGKPGQRGHKGGHSQPNQAPKLKRAKTLRVTPTGFETLRGRGAESPRGQKPQGLQVADVSRGPFDLKPDRTVQDRVAGAQRGAQSDPETLARLLLQAAASAPDPEALLEAAQALLQARPSEDVSPRPPTRARARSRGTTSRREEESTPRRSASRSPL